MASIWDRFEGSAGLLGVIADLSMAREHRAINAWVISLLKLQPQDRVLEVDFGPGYAMRQIAQRVSQGFVAGITPSEPLWRHASRRNRSAIQARRMELKVATPRAIPYPDESFDKAFSVDSIATWLDPTFNLKEIERVVKRGGVIAMAWLRTSLRGEGDLDVKRAGENVLERFKEAGWSRVQRFEEPQMDCVMGVKP